MAISRDWKEEYRHIKNIGIALFIALGLILFWRGIWEGSAKYITPTESVAIGLAILIATGVVTKVFSLGTNV